MNFAFCHCLRQCSFLYQPSVHNSKILTVGWKSRLCSVIDSLEEAALGAVLRFLNKTINVDVYPNVFWLYLQIILVVVWRIRYYSTSYQYVNNSQELLLPFLYHVILVAITSCWAYSTLSLEYQIVYPPTVPTNKGILKVKQCLFWLQHPNKVRERWET